MDIIQFNNKSDILLEKYAPKNINDIIGSKRQISFLMDWLNKYNTNAKDNLKKMNSKKNGRKNRKRKVKEVEVKNVECDGDGDGDCNEGDCCDKLEDTDEIDEKKIKKKDPNMCSCAIIAGDHGTGKTAVVNAVLNGLGYTIKSINFAKINTIKSIDSFIENLFLGNDIYDTIESTSVKKFAIVVDEIQSVWTQNEKGIINGLLKFNSELWICPVIFIGSNEHKKIMTMVKKECYQISIYPPSIDDMMRLLERIGLGEKMCFENESIVNRIIEHSQYDYRRLIVTMGELKRLFGLNVIKVVDLDNYLKFTEQKDMDRSIYQNTGILFSRYNGINSALKIFDNDRTNMPLMVHQNHFIATINYIKDQNKLMEISSDLTEDLARGDVVDNYIYSDQNWSLQESHGFYTCIYPSFVINKNIDTKKLETDSKYPYYRPVFSTDYPKDLNRTSTRCINHKNVKFANEYFKNMTIDDYVISIKLIKSLLEDGRIDECKEILKEYNLTEQGVMYVLKIDKINGTRKDVSKSIEKKVKEIAVEPVLPSIIKKR
jgi:hypothetical protein